MESSSDEWRDKDERKPGKPVCDDKPSFGTLTVRWEPPKTTINPPLRYELFYRDCTKGDIWISYKNTPETVMKVENLPSGSTFVFKVRVENGPDKIFTSEHSDEIKTFQSAACQMLEYSIPVDKKGANISVRRPPFKEVLSYRNEKARIRKFELEKTLVIVGATGAGKSTLIDSMVNYILGISWRDSFRFTVENLELEEKEVAGDQAKSQTRWITCYTIHQIKGSRINYKITIIDTPGYGHTDGNSADVKVTDQIRELFTAVGEKGIHFLDVVCFVIKASETRLVQQSEYIFKAVLSVFGKDVIKNICIMLTFADVKPPPAIDFLKAVDDLPHEEYFCFNNCAIFADNSNTQSQLYWDTSLEGFGEFFDAIEKKSPISLLLTKEVLIERKRLQITIANIFDKLAVELKVEKFLENEIHLMEESAKEAEENKNFTYKTQEVTMTYKDKKDKYDIACKKTLSHQELIGYLRQEMDKHDKYVERMFSKIASSVQKLQGIAIRNDPLSFDDYFEMLVKEQMSSDSFACLKILDLKKKLNEKTKQSLHTGTLKQAHSTPENGLRSFFYNQRCEFEHS